MPAISCLKYMARRLCGHPTNLDRLKRPSPHIGGGLHIVWEHAPRLAKNGNLGLPGLNTATKASRAVPRNLERGTNTSPPYLKYKWVLLLCTGQEKLGETEGFFFLVFVIYLFVCLFVYLLVCWYAGMLRSS